MLNASIAKHVQYPPNQQNWATDSVCCTVKECDRSWVQRLSPENWALLCTLNKNNIPIHLARQPLSLSLSLSLLSHIIFLTPCLSLPVCFSQLGFSHPSRHSKYIQSVYISLRGKNFTAW